MKKEMEWKASVDRVWMMEMVRRKPLIHEEMRVTDVMKLCLMKVEPHMELN